MLERASEREIESINTDVLKTKTETRAKSDSNDGQTKCINETKQINKQNPN